MFIHGLFSDKFSKFIISNHVGCLFRGLCFFKKISWLMLKKINFMALGYPYFKKLQSYNRLPGMMRKSVSEQQQLLLETSMHSILQSFQIHLGVAFSYTGKTKMAWRVVSMLIIQVNLNLYSTTVSQLLNEVSSVIGARTLLKVDMVYTPVAIKYY